MEMKPIKAWGIMEKGGLMVDLDGAPIVCPTRKHADRLCTDKRSERPIRLTITVDEAAIRQGR